MNRLFQEIRVFKRAGENRIIFFRCLKQISTGMFAVQSADFLSSPISTDQIVNSDLQFFELMFDQSPVERCTWHDSVDQAIAAHEADFQQQESDRSDHR
jgi:hypothetical protein